MNDIVDKALRDHVRYTGDGLAGEPVGHPLPIGDPSSGVHIPTKAELRDALADAALGDSASAALNQKIDDEIAARIAGDSAAVTNNNYAGGWDASTLAFPTLRGDGGAIKNGDYFEVEAAGTFGGNTYALGETIRAKVDAPASAAGWTHIPVNAMIQPIKDELDTYAIPFTTVAALLADTTTLAQYQARYGATGTINVRAGVYDYTLDLAQAGSGDAYISNANGVLFQPISKNGVYAAKAFAALLDGTSDDHARVQAALNTASVLGLDVMLDPGSTCAIGSTLNVKSGSALVGGTGRQRPYTLEPNNPALKALPALGTDPMVTLGVGSDDSILRRSHGVYGIEFDAAGIAEVGISVRNSVQGRVEGCMFGSFVTGGAAIRGGGNLYFYVKKNTFIAGEYYAVDLLDAYKGGSLHYYGVNVGSFEENTVSCHRGIRYEGTFDVVDNDFELRTEAGTCIQIAGTESSYTNITGNYFECLIPTSNPGSGHTLIDLGSTTQRALIVGNNIYGSKGEPGGGLAIDASGLTDGVLISHGNWIADIETAYDLPSVGVAELTIGPDQYRPDVTTHITNRAVRNAITAPGATDTVTPYQEVTDGGAKSIRGSTSFGAVFVLNQTGLNLDHGNAFYIGTVGSAVTYDTITNAKQGQLFWVMATTPNLVTLDNSVFNMACGADFLMPRDKPIMFMVDDSGTVREVGTTTCQLWSSTVADLPPATTPGNRAFVTDATVTTFATVVSGGGANSVPVYSANGAWRIG